MFLKLKLFGLLLEGLEVEGFALLRNRLDKDEDREQEGGKWRRFSFCSRSERDLDAGLFCKV